MEEAGLLRGPDKCGGLEQVERKRKGSSLDSHIESLYTAGHLEALEGLEQREVIWSNLCLENSAGRNDDRLHTGDQEASSEVMQGCQSEARGGVSVQQMVQRKSWQGATAWALGSKRPSLNPSSATFKVPGLSYLL